MPFPGPARSARAPWSPRSRALPCTWPALHVLTRPPLCSLIPLKLLFTPDPMCPGLLKIPVSLVQAAPLYVCLHARARAHTHTHTHTHSPERPTPVYSCTPHNRPLNNQAAVSSVFPHRFRPFVFSNRSYEPATHRKFKFEVTTTHPWPEAKQ